MKKISKLIKEARGIAGLKQHEFGAHYGYSRDQINNLENGRSRVPADIVLKILADYPQLRPWPCSCVEMSK